jgi:hypothetical protein
MSQRGSGGGAGNEEQSANHLVFVDPAAGLDAAAFEDDPGATVFVTTDCRAGALSTVAGHERDPDRFGQVEVGDGGTRSAAGAATGAAGTDVGGITPAWYSTVPDPDDLPGLAREIDEHLQRLAAANDRVVLHFDSLTQYLESLEPSQLFRLLHVLTSRVRTLDGVSYFYLPESASGSTSRTVEPLFDAVLEPSEHEVERATFTAREPYDPGSSGASGSFSTE